MLTKIFIFFGVLYLFVYFLYKSLRQFKSLITKELYDKEMELVKIIPLFFIYNSPFRKVKVKTVSYSTRIFGIKGEDIFYKKIICKNKSGEYYKAYVMIRTLLFKADEVFISEFTLLPQAPRHLSDSVNGEDKSKE